MTGDIKHCMRPCTDVDYSVGKDMFDFSLTDPEEVAKVGGCNRGGGQGREGVISIQFGRRFQYETVRIVLFRYAKIISEENIYSRRPTSSSWWTCCPGSGAQRGCGWAGQS